MLKDKANKALYTLKQSNIQGNITLGFKLFHSLIMPILNYCSEIWAPFFLKNINSINLTKLYDKNPLEVVHLKFCKYMLGVHKHSTNDAVRGELGSFPISLTFTKHALKYWARLTMIDTNSLIYKCYSESKYLHLDNKTNWLSHIYKILLLLDFDVENTPQIQNINQFISFISKKSQDVYTSKWKESLKNFPKLRTYSQFKEKFQLEKYLLQIKCKKTKNLLTKLRISGHDLYIETGRYTKPKKTPVDERICRFCTTGEIEDEIHLIMKCKYYLNLRNEMFGQLNIISDFNSLNFNAKFTIIMTANNGDADFCKPIAEFINKCFNKRDNLVVHTQSTKTKAS